MILSKIKIGAWTTLLLLLAGGMQPAQAQADEAPMMVLEDADSTSMAPPILRLARGYRFQAALLEAEVDDDDYAFETQLDSAMQTVRELLGEEGLAESDRFREFYRSVVTEYQAYYGLVDTFATQAGDIFEVHDNLFTSLETEEEYEEVVLPDVPALNTEIPLVINRLVEQSITYLLKNKEKTVDLWQPRAETYFPMIEQILIEEGVPAELKYLAVIESGLNPRARSWARAAGMWQFIAATAKNYGLDVNAWADERLDPEKATRAAARHLRDLYEQFGNDWHLALAGYNCSPARVRSAVRRAKKTTGGEASFWSAYRYLPRETRNYVPMFVAAALVLSNPDVFQLPEAKPGPRLEFDVVPIKHLMSLETVASLAGTEVSVVRTLNPEIRRMVVPPTKEPYMIRVPYRTGATFLEKYEDWKSERERFDLVHVVQPGESLRRIAQRYGATTGELQRANGMSSSKLIAGAELIVPVKPYQSKSAQELVKAGARSVMYRSPVVDRLAVTSDDDKGPGSNLSEVAIRAIAKADEYKKAQGSRKRVRYTVRRGDTLSEIAAKYGTSVRSLKRWNGLRSSRIRVGQRLTIYTAGGGSDSATTYRVRRGDTLGAIARRYNVSVANLKEWNGLRSSKIVVGQRLKIRQG